MAYVPVKVYRNHEIRRFILESGENQRFSFQTLLNQIRQVYPNLDTNRLRVTWKDTDGDQIILSSDLELMDAVRSLPANDQMLRIHLVDSNVEPEVMIIDQPPQQPQQEPETRQEEEQQQTDAEEATEKDPTRHRHVYCDGCRGDICGIRYKCLTCPDYDLCSNCIDQGLHDEHPMIRIASPKDKTWKPAFFAAQSPFPMHWRGRGGHGFRHGPFPFPFGMPPQHPPHGPTPPPPPPADGQAPPPPTGPVPPPMGPPFGCHRGFGRGHHRGRGRHCHGHGHHGWARMHGQEEKKADETNAQEMPQEEPTEQTPQFDAQEFARDLNETITTMLTAFGIPVATQGQAAAPKPQETATAPNPVEQPAAASATAPATHPDPKIAAALNYMLAMGYKNDGGWLTKLLEEKRGDISAVLDILHPRPGH